MDLLDIARHRYTAKAYNPDCKIPQQDIDTLLEIIRLTPSSINIQPWHFLLAADAAAKQRIARALTGTYAYNAPKVLDSSHTLVFCTRTDISDDYVLQLIARDDAAGRFADADAKAAQLKTRQGYVTSYRRSPAVMARWLENQTFIALGSALLAAPTLGMDATPIGGFDAQVLDDEFGLAERGLTASVLLTLGTHSEQDFNAALPKSRLDAQDIFTQL